MSDFIPRISTLQSLMFLINSRYPLLDHARSSSRYPEVTEKFCRVPLVLFTLLPVFTQLIDLCWYLYGFVQTFF